MLLALACRREVLAQAGHLPLVQRQGVGCRGGTLLTGYGCGRLLGARHGRQRILIGLVFGQFLLVLFLLLAAEVGESQKEDRNDGNSQK